MTNPNPHMAHGRTIFPAADASEHWAAAGDNQRLGALHLPLAASGKH
jgi:hypothetical protein